MEVIDPVYLPFTRSQLERHFTANAEANIDYFETSAKRYRKFGTAPASLAKAKHARQIEKDERFWTACALKSVYDAGDAALWTQLLVRSFGERPPLDGLGTWSDCLNGSLELLFEAQLPSPDSYVRWLRENLQRRQLIPYVHDAAAKAPNRRLEGATHVDAILLNSTNGFALLIEAKVLSDISGSVSFDNHRNQLIRNVDVMLESPRKLGNLLEQRLPERSLFALLTPRAFKDAPRSRLSQDYRSIPESLADDLPHREADWLAVSKRIGWITFEDINEIRPGACGWLPQGHVT